MSKGVQTWTCTCGATSLRVETSGGSRVICYCRSCQAFARHFGKTSMLDAHGGSDLFQVAPHQVSFLNGHDNLAAIRITDKGPARWYTACCGTPLANTWTSPNVPFATLTAVQFDDRDSLGPIQTQAFRRHARGYAEKEGGGLWILYAGFARRLFLSLVTGRWRRTPFFDGDGVPRAEIRLLSDDERARAYDADGPA